MPLSKPFHRTRRTLVNGPNAGYSSWAYIVDHEYSNSPHHYTRAFLLLQEDLLNLFEYVEPADENLKTFSYRIHGLLMRICIELEANFKAILRENIYSPIDRKGKPRTEGDWKMTDYIKVNRSHHLDSYSVEFPLWRGIRARYEPFKDWTDSSTLSWYKAYNDTKHDRDQKFFKANFENLLNAFAGLFVLLSAQFGSESFMPGSTGLALSVDSYHSGNFGLGDYLKIEYPTNWDIAEKYDFDWSVLKKEQIKFEKFDYNSI